jgi:hypothetical protein
MCPPFFRSIRKREINRDPRHFLEIPFLIEIVDPLPSLGCGQPQRFVPGLVTRIFDVCL